MLLDSQLLFSEAQAVTAAANSTNYIDLTVARDIAVGWPLKVFVAVTVAMTDGSSNSTLSVSAYYDTTTTFTPDASQLLLIVPAVSAAGALFEATLDPHLSTLYRYMTINFTPNNGDLSTGSFTVGIVLDAQRNYAYADGITIS